MTFQPIPLPNVTITSPFWSRIQQLTWTKTIPAILDAQKSSDHWSCLTWKRGHKPQPHPFWDSDIYKFLEATCSFLLINRKHPANKDNDARMMAVVGEAVDMIRNAQYDDGYINSYYTVLGVEKRWTNLRDMHELYCLGHLIEATVAYERLTKSGKLLAVAMRAIRHVDSIFGAEEGKKRGYPGHQEIEIGLIRLHELTGEALPLKLARYFILERGRKDENGEVYFDREAKERGGDPYDHMGSEHKAQYQEPRDYGYHQADCKIGDAEEVKGHSVRAMYYYTAVTDLVRLCGAGDEDEEVVKAKPALERLWRDMVDRKMYVTGGIGSVTQWEGFGPPYLLPDLESEGCYSETCATFALVVWCQRLLRLGLKSEYADVMELALYNGFLGALAADGDAFYYQNVLRTRSGEKKERSRWFGVACCPPNVAKLLASMGSLIYSYNPAEDLVAIHLYIGSELEVPGTDVRISITTDMPWSGDVSIRVQGKIALALRIPAWLRDQKYSCSSQGELKDGYLCIPASENAEIKLTFPMKAQKVYVHPNTGKDEISIMRGPLVYCVEDVDNGDTDIDNVALLDAEIKEESPVQVASMPNVVPVVATGKQLVRPSWPSLYGSQAWSYESGTRSITAIPYFLRSNRGGDGAMRVWTKRLGVQ